MQAGRMKRTSNCVEVSTESSSLAAAKPYKHGMKLLALHYEQHEQTCRLLRVSL